MKDFEIDGRWYDLIILPRLGNSLGVVSGNVVCIVDQGTPGKNLDLAKEVVRWGRVNQSGTAWNYPALKPPEKGK